MCEDQPRNIQGTTLTIPVSEPAAGALRVLLVDDNADVAESLGVLLSLYGHTVLAFTHPLDALDSAQGFDPHVCILDVGLPCMTGHDLARRLRAAGLREATYIAVTGYGADEIRNESALAGFALHLTKPVDPQYLIEQLTEMEGDKGLHMRAAA